MKSTSSVKQSTRLFWQFTKPYKKYFWLSTVGSGLGVITQDVLPPIVVAKAFTRLQTHATTGTPLSLSDFWPYIIAYFALMIVAIAIWRIQVWFAWQFEVKSIRDIAIKIFDHLQHQGSTFHANRFGGALVSQANKFLSAYEKVSDEFTWAITPGIVMFVTAFGVLLATDTRYAIFFGIASLLFFWFAYRRTSKTMKYDRDLASSESDRTAKLADMITNVSTVSAFAGENHEYKLFQKQATETYKKQYSLLDQVMINDTLSHLFVNNFEIVAFIAGIAAITILDQPAGALYLAVNYTFQLADRLWESRRTMRNLNRAFGDASDMTEILQLQPDIQDKPGATELKVRGGTISLDNVNFAYEEDHNKLLFKDLSMEIKAGQKVGLVGHSGGGKTSLTKLLLRFLDINGGQILVDGQNIADATQSSLRSNIAYVSQEPLLFHRTIAENISYGKPNASMAEVKKVAKMAHADEFIDQLSSGYETLVGERGVKLSGGQRQRIAIARAMLKDAPILILDEATSALDSESEVLIQDALWKLMEGRTAIVIAHRLSTVQKMDRIIVLDKGQIAEEGTHKELLKHKGIYANLWGHQSGGFLED